MNYATKQRRLAALAREAATKDVGDVAWRKRLERWLDLREPQYDMTPEALAAFLDVHRGHLQEAICV